MRISVELNTKVTQQGQAVQLVLVSQGRARFAIGVHVDAKSWDRKKQRVRFGHEHATVVNARIAAEVARAEGLALEHPGITPAALRDLLRRGPVSSDFVELALQDLADSPPKSLYTRKQRRCTLVRFGAWAGPVQVADVDSRLMDRYRHHLLRNGVARNAAAVYLKRLRTVYRRCCKLLGLAPVHILEGCDAVERYTEQPSRLTPEEVSALMAYADRHTKWRAKAVHMWLFSFFSAGIRWGDMCRLRIDHLRDGRVQLPQHKTGAPKDVALHPYAAKVAGLYRKGHYVFGVAGDQEPTEARISGSNAQANKWLKVAAQACGINKRLHTHNARHSFAAQALEADLDDRAIQTAMGISDEVYRHYRGRIRPERVDSELSKVLGGFTPE